MKIKKLRWRNFTSWGNAWNELEFGETSSVTLLCGNNGAGKSSISNLVVYMLYGQLDGFTQKEIPNRINKSFEGYIEIEGGGNNVVVHRGLNPSIFEVTVNGKTIDTAGKANVQHYLESEVYGIPYTLFKNSIVLSVNDFKSFISLTPKEKREIVDRLFGFEVVNNALAKSKEMVRDAKQSLAELNSKLDGYLESVSTIQSKIASVREEIQKRNNDNGINAECEKRLAELGECEKRLDDGLLKIRERKNKGGELYRAKLAELTECETQANLVKRQLGLYQSNRCPTCGAPLDSDEHVEHKRALLEKRDALETAKTAIEEETRKISDAFNKLDAKQEEIRQRLSGIRVEMEKTRQLQSAGTESDKKRLDELEKIAGDIETKIESAEKEKRKFDAKLKILTLVCSVFSENGLKRYMGNMYVPVINQYVEDNRSRLGVPYRIVFDANYDCKIFQLGEEIGYKTLSNGERKKADIAVTLAFLKIMKTRVNDINLLFLDEVLSSIDVSSCNELLAVFKEYAAEMNISMYLVHHANLENSIVDRVVEVRKQNGFSHFVQ